MFGNTSQVHTVDNSEDIMVSICHNEFPDPSNIKIDIQIYPEGTKNFVVEFSGIKIFLHPYFYLMISHFFTVNMPTYDNKSLDKPNDYTEDFEDSPEINMLFKL